MSKKSIVVLAAGMGSRYGGVKQLEPVGPSGEFLSEYGIYDDLKCGFERVIFVIKKEHLDTFKNHICANFNDKIEVCFAFQSLEDIPSDVKMPEGRTKAWGTTQALLAAKPYIDGPFVMINADDFNGFDSYKQVADFFNQNNNEKEYMTVNYPLGVTLSDNGTVKRGVCIAENSVVENIIESEITKDGKTYIAKPLNGDIPFEITKDQPVTVNFFGLKPSIFKYLEDDFDIFMHGNIDDKCECLMPDTLKRLIKNGEVKMYEGVSHAMWFGMTYKEDLPMVKDNINELINKGDYPNNLWS